MAYQVAHYIYLLSLLCASVAGLYRYRTLDTASKILAILICCTFLNEMAAYYLAKKYNNNLALYAIFSLGEFCTLCIYFNEVVDVFVKKRLGIYIGLIGVLFGIADLVFLQHIDTFNSYFLLFEGLMVIGISLFAFFRFLLKYDSLNLYAYHHFWFICILIFFWSITFLSWGLYDYINRELLQTAININIALVIISTVTYSCFAIVFFLYPKMKSINE